MSLIDIDPMFLRFKNFKVFFFSKKPLGEASTSRDSMDLNGQHVHTDGVLSETRPLALKLGLKN